MADSLYAERDLDIPPLRVSVQYRKSIDDGGPVVRVFGPVEGEERQLLRIGCFEENPHYHLDPTGRDRVVLLHTRGREATLKWIVQQFRDRLVDLILEAGYPEIAEAVDLQTIPEWLPDLEQALQDVLKESSRPL